MMTGHRFIERFVGHSIRTSRQISPQKDKPTTVDYQTTYMHMYIARIGRYKCTNMYIIYTHSSVSESLIVYSNAQRSSISSDLFLLGSVKQIRYLDSSVFSLRIYLRIR